MSTPEESDAQSPSHGRPFGPAAPPGPPLPPSSPTGSIWEVPPSPPPRTPSPRPPLPIIVPSEQLQDKIESFLSDESDGGGGVWKGFTKLSLAPVVASSSSSLPSGLFSLPLVTDGILAQTSPAPHLRFLHQKSNRLLFLALH